MVILRYECVRKRYKAETTFDIGHVRPARFGGNIAFYVFLLVAPYLWPFLMSFQRLVSPHLTFHVQFYVELLFPKQDIILGTHIPILSYTVTFLRLPLRHCKDTISHG